MDQVSAQLIDSKYYLGSKPRDWSIGTQITDIGYPCLFVSENPSMNPKRSKPSFFL